ncbi:ABC transporter permease [Mahella australiensis]|uniref:Binding-protein-dependent transport systems inner membrane component n=1 Tax=Mahella australiensis (strain DSM 15567 / CIP 107919 / 50-1 BON) TaxID=697281 RepID=F4A2H8_MAHA5|nr:ABC transporter permease [Mahella australiensis]AEE97244.1 binding-protein-dependent transport systems inner membrane component [Mahella australiensis 50-1 BON]
MAWIRRLMLIILTIFFAMTITFVVIRMMPGNPVETLAMDMVRNQGVNYEEAYARAKSMLNYDPDIPIIQQYSRYVSGLLKGNFGESMSFKKPVVQVIAGALPWTLLLLSISLFISFIIGIFIGMYVAWKRNTIVDPIVSIYASIAGSIPDYIVGLILIIIFAVNLKWLPNRGPYDSSVMPGFNWPYISSVLEHAILPISAYVITGLGGWALAMKGNAISVLGEDYVTAAKARGLSQRRIITTYVGRNALLPLITNLAISFGMMFGGSPLVENIFVYPGVGYFLNQAVGRRDFTLMQGMFLMITIAVVLANLIAEILYSILDPRIRQEG